MQGEQGLRREVVHLCTHMYDRGYIAGADGNVSVRLGTDRIAVTPSGVHKGFLKPADLVITDLDGRPQGRTTKPTSELAMHLEIYRLRPDVRAVVHAHPPYAIAASVAGVSLAQCLLPEVIFALGSIHHAGYATPTTDDVPAILREPLRHHDALILDRHGTVTLGPDVQTAFNRLESVEHTAKVSAIATRLCGSTAEPVIAIVMPYALIGVVR